MYTIPNKYQSHKINLFYITGTAETPSNDTGVTENRNSTNTLIDSYANQAISLLEKNPEVQNSLITALKSMSESVLKDPENIKKLLEKVQDSDKIDSKSKTGIMILILEKHAELMSNIDLKNKIDYLKNGITSDSILIRAKTFMETQEALKGLKR